MLKVGLLGCGAIGTVIAKALDEGKAGEAKLVIAYDLLPGKASELKAKLSGNVKIAGTFEELASSDVELVVEAASQEAVKLYAENVVEAGKNLVVMSVGALLDDALLERVMHAAKKRNVKVYVPTGAITGIDALKAASMEKVESVVLTTTKPPSGFGITCSERKVLYEGAAEEAVKLYPKNINVAATLSLAGIGKKRTKVKLVADPKASKITHEITIKGEFGEINSKIGNLPFPENPKTSYIAALSAVRLIKRLTEVLIVGT